MSGNEYESKTYRRYVAGAVKHPSAMSGEVMVSRGYSSPPPGYRWIQGIDIYKRPTLRDKAYAAWYVVRHPLRLRRLRKLGCVGPYTL